MPSPVGHALGGAAAGWAVATLARLPLARLQPWRSGLFFAVLGMLPDIDLVIGAHSGPTHGLGSGLIAGLGTAALTRSGRLGLAGAAAYASHTLLDWLGSDSSPPIGIMALWPLSDSHYESDVHLFHAISRRYWLPGFVEQNARAVLWELAMLVPPAVLALAVRLRWPAPTASVPPDQYR